MPAKKKNRCWPGYEPVKGKRKNQQGSCRPKAKSKLKVGEKKFRAKRRKQVDRWQAEHPHTRRSASQGLRKPGTARRRAATKTTVSKRRSARSRVRSKSSGLHSARSR